MKVYINYPNPHITIHRSNECPLTQRRGEWSRRIVVVNSRNLASVLTDFINDKYRFTADREHNDLWLNISLDTPKQEESLVYIIQAILGLRYSPLKGVAVIEHACPDM